MTLFPSRCWFVLTALAGLLVIGCKDQRPAGLHPEYSEPFINGYVYKIDYADGSSDYQRDFEVVDARGLRMVPILTLNDWPVYIYYYSATRYQYGDDQPNLPLSLLNLNVKHYWGEAFARVTMPGDFRITTPRGNYIMGLESTLVITWRRSPAAQWYWLSLWITYDYLDSLSEWDSRDVYFDTLLHDTVYSIAPERVFGPDVVTLVEGDAIIDVWCGNGPPIEPGDIGNIRGCGHGFFNAVNEPPDAYFYVGAPPLARRCPGRDEQRGRFLARLNGRVPPLRTVTTN